MKEQKRIKIKASDLRFHYEPIPSHLVKLMLSTYDTEMETGDYSPNDALYHAKDEAIEELKSEYDFNLDVTEKEFDDILEELFNQRFYE